MMDGFLFDIEDYTDTEVVRIMQGHTCRTCANRMKVMQGNEGSNKVQACAVRKSNRTKSGQLRVRVDQPACILYTSKNNAK